MLSNNRLSVIMLSVVAPIDAQTEWDTVFILAMPFLPSLTFETMNYELTHWAKLWSVT